MTEKVPVSVVMLTRNEELNIKDCLERCSFAEEILIIDDGSTDSTVEIAKTFGAKILYRPLSGDWGAQQTFGIQNASQPWVFLLDADERVTETLTHSIRDAVQNVTQYCYWIQRKTHYLSNDKEAHGALRPDLVLRLMPKAGSYVDGVVHPKIVSPYPEKKLKGDLVHYSYRDWGQYWRKFDKYTKLAADKYQLSGRKCSFAKDILLRPLWAFIKVYFINKGFLDGHLGFIFSVNHALYTMTKYVRLYTNKKTNGLI